MPQKIIAGNWKMNLLFHEVTSLAIAICNKSATLQNTTVILFPPIIYAEQVAACCHESKNIFIGAQNCSQHDKGAYTGEIAASMIDDVGAKYVLVGHSERRQYFNETNKLLADKTKQILKYNLQPIYCCGESLKERESNQHFNVVEQQITEGLSNLDKSDLQKCIIAYEPVWAIGTGKTASAIQAQEMHVFIRSIIEKNYGNHAALNISILYGGSVTAANVFELFACADVDGALVGGASLKLDDFISIINSIENTTTN